MALNNILNKLFIKTNIYIEIKIDYYSTEIALSTIYTDKFKRIIPVIVVNPRLMPTDENLKAHILAHEYGHHIYKHVFDCNVSHEERQRREDEADLYAHNFVCDHGYNINIVRNNFLINQHNLNSKIYESIQSTNNSRLYIIDNFIKNKKKQYLYFNIKN